MALEGKSNLNAKAWKKKFLIEFNWFLSKSDRAWP
jgi:hypothetical protein